MSSICFVLQVSLQCICINRLIYVVAVVFFSMHSYSTYVYKNSDTWLPTGFSNEVNSNAPTKQQLDHGPNSCSSLKGEPYVKQI